jgi:hypothetical protein
MASTLLSFCGYDKSRPVTGVASKTRTPGVTPILFSGIISQKENKRIPQGDQLL